MKTRLLFVLALVALLVVTAPLASAQRRKLEVCPDGQLLYSANRGWSCSGTMALTADGDLTVRDLSARGLILTADLTALAATLQSVKLTPGAASKPTCAVGVRGTIWYAPGGAGVLDTAQICRKDAADAYAWVSLF
jgi:hypothetical protein